MRQLTHFAAAVIGVTLLTGAVMPRAASAQMLAGLRSEWGDLETWTHPQEATRETELGLGLQLNGQTGATLVAFMGRLSLRDPRTPPRELDVQVGTGKMTNPTLIRRPVLSFVADEGTDKARTINLSGRLSVDNPSPGAIITDGVSRIDAADFVRLATSTKIQATVLGFDANVRPDQIAALKALARRLQLRGVD